VLTLIPLVDNPSTLEPSWTEVRRIYRRICLLRSEGRRGEAQRIEETELAAASAEARGGSAPGPDADARLDAIMAGERERVDSALALAEILAPMLSDRLVAPAPAAGAETARPQRPVSAPSGEARGIADYIDEMLAQERAGSA